MIAENKAVAGYHILMILSHVDGHFASEEADVVHKYIKQHFATDFNLDEENHFLKTLHPHDYYFHFKVCMDNFYRKSSPTERSSMIDFAVKMVKADRKITREENIFLNELLNGWEPEHA